MNLLREYPGGILRLGLDMVTYFVSTLFILLCGLIRVVLEIPLRLLGRLK